VLVGAADVVRHAWVEHSVEWPDIVGWIVDHLAHEDPPRGRGLLATVTAAARATALQLTARPSCPPGTTVVVQERTDWRQDTYR
jgi:hypothetical protein